eukprot:9500530-Pyramimonas_sp.AAC.1
MSKHSTTRPSNLLSGSGPCHGGCASLRGAGGTSSRVLSQTEKAVPLAAFVIPRGSMTASEQLCICGVEETNRFSIYGFLGQVLHVFGVRSGAGQGGTGTVLLQY